MGYRLISAVVLFLFSLSCFAAPPAECNGSIKCIALTWETPTQRIDGTAIESLEGYKIYHTASNVFQGAYDIAPDAVEYYIVDVSHGTHTFTIAAVEFLVEGDQSAPASVAITQAKIGPMTLTIEIL